MKKLTTTTLLVTGIISGGVLGNTLMASANEMSSMQTNTNIGFSDHNSNENSNGDLDILWGPKSFDFGNSNNSKTEPTDYKEKTGLNKYIVVRDARNSNGAEANTKKWSLNATATDLTAGDMKLTNAYYHFDLDAKAYNSVSGQDTESPNEDGAIIALPGASTVEVEKAPKIVAGSPEAAPLMKDQTSVDEKVAAELSNIQLLVPANTSQPGSQYTGTINWTLSDTI